MTDKELAALAVRIENSVPDDRLKLSSPVRELEALIHVAFNIAPFGSIRLPTDQLALRNGMVIHTASDGSESLRAVSMLLHGDGWYALSTLAPGLKELEAKLIGQEWRIHLVSDHGVGDGKAIGRSFAICAAAVRSLIGKKD